MINQIVAINYLKGNKAILRLELTSVADSEQLLVSMDDEKRKLVKWFVFMAALFLVIGGAFTLGILVDFQKIKDVERWPTTEGTLITQVIRTGKDGQSDQSVRYRFMVDGKEFESSKVAPNQFTQGESDFFKISSAAKTTVMVHYNKSNPFEAYLVNRWNPLEGTSVYYAVSSIFFATVFGITTIVMNKKNGSAEPLKRAID